MATYNKFNSFIEYAMEGGVNLATNQLAVALTTSANAPNSTISAIAGITQIDYTNCSSRNITTLNSSTTSGVYGLTLQDLTLTASGTGVTTFRYVVIYDDTHASDILVCWYDYGSDVTLAAGETFTIDFGATLFTIS